MKTFCISPNGHQTNEATFSFTNNENNNKAQILFMYATSEVHARQIRFLFILVNKMVSDDVKSIAR